jgi:hypothetical protein
MPELAYRSYATRLALCLTVALGVVAAHTYYNRGRRGELERVIEATAVGDRQFFPVGENQPAVSFQGRVLSPIGGAPKEIRETKVLRAGTDATGRYHVYVHRPPEGETGKEEKARVENSAYLLKTGPSQFVEFQLADQK